MRPEDNFTRWMNFLKARLHIQHHRTDAGDRCLSCNSQSDHLRFGLNDTTTASGHWHRKKSRWNYMTIGPFGKSGSLSLTKTQWWVKYHESCHQTLSTVGKLCIGLDLEVLQFLTKHICKYANKTGNMRICTHSYLNARETDAYCHICNCLHVI